MCSVYRTQGSLAISNTKPLGTDRQAHTQTGSTQDTVSACLSAQLYQLPCRGTEVVESTVRQHIGACFSALEQRVLTTLTDASHQLGATPNTPPADKLILQV